MRLTELEEEIGIAATYLDKMYTRLAKTKPIIRLRSEVVYYDLHNFWIKKVEDLEIFLALIIKIIHKFPDAAPHFIVETLDMMENLDMYSFGISWSHGYISRYYEEYIDNLEFTIDLES